ncbi:LysR family transcriptional regulator [Parasalinivibrio latis]|uniref:LysR family transcriptional regulator n=1 Tax=Parasalinivibrio latis TaxID=2952610 RepID=UPI0030DF73AC
MDIESLRTFLAIVETGSFTRAANQVFRTQSAISKQINRLEEEIGAPLFDRDLRPLAPTPTGQRLISKARTLVEQHDEALLSLRKQGQAPVIKLGCPDDYAETVLPVFISTLRKTIGNVTIEILCASTVRLRSLLDRGELDIALITRAPDSDEGWLLLRDKGCWVYPSADKAIFDRRPLPVALFNNDCKFHASAVDGLGKAGIDFSLVAFTSSASSLRGLVRHGVAVSAMAKCSVPGDLSILADGDYPSLPAIDIVAVLPTAPHPVLTVSLLQQLTQQVQTFYSDKNIADALIY